MSEQPVPAEVAEPGPPGPPGQPGPPGRVRYWLVTAFLWLAVRVYLRLRVEGVERLPGGPAMLCFNHQSWADPFVVVAALPARPDVMFFGPREADMGVGRKNRLIRWSQRGVPFRPDKKGLLAVARRVHAVFERGDRLAIAPEGRIHAGERVVLPLDEGVAFFALRAGVPIVPIGITGVGWLRFGGTVRVRVGQPIPASGRPTKENVTAMTTATRRALLDLVRDGRDREPPGRFGRWLTEVFQDWPEGARPPIQEHE
ncbi:MAG: 1-acyl-sn-glycerol-3-phosphate acyltransferase [Chloroflexi bacterium]|nr:1-acyl-sn-glycerol-3-phosphate acyltransferase [Chloroflexota bacterium]